MKIMPVLYNDLFIRFDCLLAYSDNLDLLDVDEIKYKIERFHKDTTLLRDQKFHMVHAQKIKEKDLESFSITDYTAIKDYLYLTNESKFYYYFYLIIFLDLLIEKRLGKNEDIAVGNKFIFLILSYFIFIFRYEIILLFVLNVL
jgi:hypothetical protein